MWQDVQSVCVCSAGHRLVLMSVKWILEDDVSLTDKQWDQMSVHWTYRIWSIDFFEMYDLKLSI